MVEPFTSKLERLVKPPRAVRVPVKLAADEIVWPFIKPDVTTPRFEFVEKRLVEDAVVANKFVVVALVPVAFTKVKFWRVEEPVTSKLVKFSVEADRLVNVPVVEKRLVVVAFVPVAFTKVKFCNFADKVFGSNQNGAVVVEVPPIVTTSVLLRG